MIDNNIPITAVPRAIREIVGEKSSAPSYRQIYGAVLNGSIPAEQRNGRWHVSSNLKPIIKYFGLTEKA